MSEEKNEEETSPQQTSQKEQLARLARLAHLHVAEGDSADFAAIAEWFEKVKQIDTEGIDPMTNPRERQGKEKVRLRKDEVDDGNVRDALLENALDPQHGFFVVPKVVE